MGAREPELPDPKILVELVNTKMPFGKYKGSMICDLPEYYLLWLRQKGLPGGKLGILLDTMLEIRINGLNYLLDPLRKN